MKTIQSFNLSIENVRKLDAFEGSKSQFIDSLLTRHFNVQKSEEELREDFLVLDRERNVAKARLDECISYRLGLDSKQKDIKVLSVKEKERTDRMQELKYKWQKEEISDDDYFKMFDSQGSFIG
jgi:hypothetical protein